MIKKYIKPLLPKPIKKLIIFFINFHVRELDILDDFMHDYIRYVKYSATISNFKNKNQIESFLIKEYHAIEKALSFRTPRPGFGVDRINLMLNYLDLYISKYGKDSTTQICIDTLHQYFLFNKSFNLPDNPTYIRVRELVLSTKDSGLGGVLSLRKEDIYPDSFDGFSKFMKSRHSIREFEKNVVDEQLILNAIDIARYTPSACNRQAWRVYYLSRKNEDLFNRVLDTQNGNAGFRDEFSTVLLVTGNIGSFYEYERSQAYIDGGMFSMSLLLALHSLKIGSCCLNTSFTFKNEKRFRKEARIMDSETPIMLIAVGHLKEEFKIAKSPRKEASDFFTVL